MLFCWKMISPVSMCMASFFPVSVFVKFQGPGWPGVFWVLRSGPLMATNGHFCEFHMSPLCPGFGGMFCSKEHMICSEKIPKRGICLLYMLYC